MIKSVKLLVEDESESVEDLACDFIEQRLGRFNFRINWERFLKKFHDVKHPIEAWLTLQRKSPGLAADIAAEIDRMYKSNTIYR